jgi:hypothetical protein
MGSRTRFPDYVLCIHMQARSHSYTNEVESLALLVVIRSAPFYF